MILVTGGTGFIGRRLVATLAKSGCSLRVLTRARNARAVLHEAVDIQSGDLLDARSLRDAAAGADTIVHLAGAITPSDASADAFRVNVEGTRNLADAARAAGVTALIHCSSAGVYGSGVTEIPHAETAIPSPGSAYERSKLEGERALVDSLSGSSVRWTILRPAGVHGPDRPATRDFYRMLQRRRIWIHGPARAIVHPTYVDDVVQVIRLVMDRTDVGGEVFNVGGERALDYREWIAMSARALDMRVVQVTPMPGVFRFGSVILSGAMRALGSGAPEFVQRLTPPILNRAVDVSKARRVLGFHPVPLDAGIRESVNGFRQLERSSGAGPHTGGQ